MFKKKTLFLYFSVSILYSQWTQLNNLSFFSLEDGVAVWDNTAYVLSGDDRQLYVYDQLTDSFSSAPAEWFDVGSPLGMFAIEGKLYASGARQVGQFSTNDLWYAYNIATGNWEQKASFPFEPVALNSLRMFRIEDDIYLIDTSFELFYKYDVATDTWSQLAYTFPDMNFRFYATVFTVDNQAFLGSALDISAIPGNVWYTYNPVSNSWSSVSPLMVANTPSEMSCTEHNGFAYCALGRMDVIGVGVVSSNRIFRYDPVNDSWQEVANGPYGAVSPIVFTVNNELFIGGGADGVNFTQEFYKQPIATLQTAEVQRKKPSVAYLRNQKEFVSDVNMTEMVIYSFEGKLVLRKKVNDRTYRLTANELPQGVYVAQIGLDSKENKRIKFIVD